VQSAGKGLFGPARRILHGWPQHVAAWAARGFAASHPASLQDRTRCVATRWAWCVEQNGSRIPEREWRGELTNQAIATE
jgi:hypothetical protein